MNLLPETGDLEDRRVVAVEHAHEELEPHWLTEAEPEHGDGVRDLAKRVVMEKKVSLAANYWWWRHESITRSKCLARKETFHT